MCFAQFDALKPKATAVTTWLLMWTTYSTFLAYDTRFRNDDVVSTVFKLFQIGVLVMIAGYTNCSSLDKLSR